MVFDRDYNRDPDIQALKRREFNSHGSYGSTFFKFSIWEAVVANEVAIDTYVVLPKLLDEPTLKSSERQAAMTLASCSHKFFEDQMVVSQS